jgi:hypothetical protein
MACTSFFGTAAAPHAMLAPSLVNRRHVRPVVSSRDREKNWLFPRCSFHQQQQWGTKVASDVISSSGLPGQQHTRDLASCPAAEWVTSQLWHVHGVPPDHLFLDSVPNLGPLISRWKLHKFKNSQNKSFRTSKILTLLYQQSSNLLVSQPDMSGPRLGTLSNNRWSGGIQHEVQYQSDVIYYCDYLLL